MPRPRKTSLDPALTSGLMGWANALGEALGRGVARGLNQALSAAGLSAGGQAAVLAPRRRGRPPKPVLGYVPPDQRCAAPGCGRPARAKGLCSAHYQAARRKMLPKA